MSLLPSFKSTKIAPHEWFAQHEICTKKVQDYFRDMKSGCQFPPVIVVRYGDKVMPLDGHHRLSAAKLLSVLFDAFEYDGEAVEDFCRECADNDVSFPDAILVHNAMTRP